jgi:hypothetical protein
MGDAPELEASETMDVEAKTDKSAQINGRSDGVMPARLHGDRTQESKSEFRHGTNGICSVKPSRADLEGRQDW